MLNPVASRKVICKKQAATENDPAVDVPEEVLTGLLRPKPREHADDTAPQEAQDIHHHDPERLALEV